jgi:hypothetical protein
MMSLFVCLLPDRCLVWTTISWLIHLHSSMQPDLGFCSSVCIYLCNVVLSCPFIPLPPLSHVCITHGAVIIAAVISFLCFCVRIFHDVSTLQLSRGSNFSIWPSVFVDMMEEVSQSAEIRWTCWGVNKMFLFGSPVCANRQIVGWSFLPCDSCQKFLILGRICYTRTADQWC